jgi:hypothetical protein
LYNTTNPRIRQWSLALMAFVNLIITGTILTGEGQALTRDSHGRDGRAGAPCWC